MARPSHVSRETRHFYSREYYWSNYCHEENYWVDECYQSRVLKPGVHPRAGNPEVTSIPRVDYSTSQRQLTSTHAEVTYLIKPRITTKPVVHTN